MIQTLSQDSLERAAELIFQAEALLMAAGVGVGKPAQLRLNMKIMPTRDTNRGAHTDDTD